MMRVLVSRRARRRCLAIVATGGRRRAWAAWRTRHSWVAVPRDGRAYAPAEAAEVAALIAAAVAAEVAA
ncbi:MAG: hypothetical protein ACYDDQ_01810 [Vulcanimicrobiaceae bacterium]